MNEQTATLTLDKNQKNQKFIQNRNENRVFESTKNIPTNKKINMNFHMNFYIIIAIIICLSAQISDAQLVPFDASCGQKPAGCDQFCPYGYRFGSSRECLCSCFPDPCQVRCRNDEN
jgi:hypothetical protein